MATPEQRRKRKVGKALVGSVLIKMYRVVVTTRGQ